MKNCLIILLFSFLSASTLFSTDGIDRQTFPKETLKVGERMQKEKRADEQAAIDNASRVKVARFDAVWRNPKSEDIDVIQTNETPARPVKAIALLTFECAAHEETQAVAGFIAKSKDLGADAVSMIRFDAPNANQAVQNIFAPNDRRVFRANALIYRKSD